MLQRIDLTLPRVGFRQFLSAWVLQGEGPGLVLVDPGPRACASQLLEALSALGEPDLVLLTHVHLDHAGAAGEVARAFPRARFWVHPEGVPHVVDPGRLWKASLTVLGDVARAYEEPTPVPADRLVGEDALGDEGIRVVPTPGHAPHHACFAVDDVIFVGEALGTRWDGPVLYARPATPPRWSAPIHLESIARIEALERAGARQRVAFGHHGEDQDLLELCHRARDQLQSWLGWGRQVQTARALMERILERDPWCGAAALGALPPDIQERERYFLGNSVAGVWDWLARST